MKVDLDKFCQDAYNDITMFRINMTNEKAESRTREEWMQTFLNWLKWQTKEHDKFWKD